MLKQILSRFGFSDMIIKFEPENRQIGVRYTFAGQEQEKKISFEQIEGAFTERSPALDDA